MLEVPKNTLSTWKKHKEKIYKNYERGLGATRVKPEKYEAVNKAVMKWLLIMRSENLVDDECFKKINIKTVDMQQYLPTPNFSLFGGFQILRPNFTKRMNENKT